MERERSNSGKRKIHQYKEKGQSVQRERSISTKRKTNQYKEEDQSVQGERSISNKRKAISAMRNVSIRKKSHQQKEKEQSVERERLTGFFFSCNRLGNSAEPIKLTSELLETSLKPCL